MNARSAIVYVVDDDRELGHSLRELCTALGYDSDYCSNGERLLEAIDPSRPGCIVLDLNLEDESGLEVARTLGRDFNSLPVILYTGFATTSSTVEAMQLDVFDVIEKSPDVEKLAATISRALVENQTRLELYAAYAEFRRRFIGLSPSEKYVLKMMLDGVPNKAMKADLDVSLRTIENRRSSVFKKLGLRGLPDVIRKSMEFEDLFDEFLGDIERKLDPGSTDD